MPKGLQAQRVPREIHPVHNHPIQHVWPMLGKQIYEFLDSLKVMWSSIDVARFAEIGGEAGPVHLWIGVLPQSLSSEDAKNAAIGCKGILGDEFGDIEIAFRESTYSSAVGPQLLSHVPIPIVSSVADLRSRFTPALGIPIAPRGAPFEGTGALYLREGSDSERLLLLTARHVALPETIHNNEPYSRKGQSQHTQDQEVLILSDKAYSDAIKAMLSEIGHQVMLVTTYNSGLAALGEVSENDNAETAAARQKLQEKVTEAQVAIAAVTKFHDQITKHWAAPSQRVLGYVFHSPPISYSTGPKQFVEDWALVDLFLDKIDWSDFKGNVIYLGNKISITDFIIKMNPDLGSSEPPINFPADGLLKIKGIVEENELRNQRLIVIKNGLTTGVTVGRSTGIESFIRKDKTSMAVAVYPYSYRDAAFSARGDSGSIVVDGRGRIVGLLIGGNGATEAFDVTYLTPYFWIEEQIKNAFPNSYLIDQVATSNTQQH